MATTSHLWSSVHLRSATGALIAVQHVRIPVRVVVVSAADVFLGGAARMNAAQAAGL